MHIQALTLFYLLKILTIHFYLTSVLFNDLFKGRWHLLLYKIIILFIFFVHHHSAWTTMSIGNLPFVKMTLILFKWAHRPPPQVNPDRFNGHPFGSWLPIVSDTNHLVTLRPLKILLFPPSSSSLTYLERSILIMIWLFYIFHIKVIFLYVKMKYITWKATYNFPMCYIIYPLCWTLLKFAFH